MDESYVRLISADISNFKNVRHGHLDFESKDPERASVLGLYGQNGSGKTTLIDALQVLKYALQGGRIPEQYAEYINVGADTAKFSFTFQVSAGAAVSAVYYDFSLEAADDNDASNMEEAGRSEAKQRIRIFNEKLCIAHKSDSWTMRKSVFADTDTDHILLPANKFAALFGHDKEIQHNLLIAKALTLATSRSFLFSREFLEAVRAKKKRASEHKDLQLFTRILYRLVQYGHFDLHIINQRDAGIISVNILPLSFRYTKEKRQAGGKIPLTLDKPSAVPEREYRVIETVLSNMNIVLQQIVPGLTIRMKNLGPTVLKNGENGYMVALMSKKNSREIPLLYESEGIKKIISILQLLIVVYNHESITVAIDELDSGIFEYLLGELLHIIAERGKGQLIFTSHNLRPLETLDKDFIAFTTTNPDKRYVRMNHVKTNNNLRSFYYRDIVVGGQKEELYSPTHNAEIAFAFREAGAAL